VRTTDDPAWRWSRWTAGDDPFEDAVEIGPHRKGGALLLPKVDARALAERLNRLEDLLDDVLTAEKLRERYRDRKTFGGKPLEQVERELYESGLLSDE
jgi:hypothetical protein